MLLSTNDIIIKDKFTPDDYTRLFWLYQDFDSIKYLRIAKRIMAYDNPGELEADFKEVMKLGAQIHPIYIWGYENTLIGYILYDPKKNDLGIYLGKNYHKKGLGRAAMKLMMDELIKNKKVAKVIAETCDKNEAAIKILESLDFVEVRREKNDRKILKQDDGEWTWKDAGTIYFEVTKEDYGKPKGDEEIYIPPS